MFGDEVKVMVLKKKNCKGAEKVLLSSGIFL